MTNYRTGLFRLWLVGAAAWLAWAHWSDLMSKCPEFFEELDMDMRAMCHFSAQDVYTSNASLLRNPALELMLLPPVSAFVLGLALLWVAGGFRSQKSN
jgi:hypothetical protein